MGTVEILDDFTNICRCCMEAAAFDLFKTYFENEPLAKLLAVCTNQRISKHDIFPNNICQGCLQSLIAAYIFKQKVVKTQQALVSIARVVDKAKVKKNGNVSKDHTYHHETQQIVSSQQIGGQLDQQFTSLSGQVKVEVDNQDEEYLDHVQNQVLEGTGMEVKYIKQSVDGEEQGFWLQEVNEEDGNSLEPNQHAEAFDMNNILQSVKVLNHHQFPDGTYAQEGEEFQTIEFIDGNVNYTQEPTVESIQKDKIHICRVCNEGFYTSRELHNHSQMEDHPQRCCNTCFQPFHSYSELIRHCMDTQHARPPMYKCPYCFKKCDNKMLLQMHIRTHVKTNNIRVTKDKKGNLGCQVCRTAYINIQELKQHYKENQPTHLTCHICLEKFNHISILETHLAQHEEMKPFGCEICGSRFNLQINFERHLKKHTQSQMLYKCQYCTKVFSDETSVEEHEKTHYAVEPYEAVEVPEPADIKSHYCPQCNKVFTSGGFLKKHIERFHLGLEQSKNQRVMYECEICAKVLSCKATLYSHMKNVHEKNQKLFTCEICGKVLKTKTSLELHTNFHNGKCPFKCNVCGKAFTNATTLKSHSLIHTNERPHECQVCRKTFKQKPHLTTHILTIHTALKLHKCDYCEKTFALKGNLSQHLKTHTGCDSPFVCGVCNKAFYFASRLRKHEKIHIKP